MSIGAAPVSTSAEPGSLRPRQWRPVVVASEASVVLVVLAAAAMLGRPWLAASRFHVEHLIPWVVGFEVTRVWAAWGAAVVVCFHITALHHGGFYVNETVTPLDAVPPSWSRKRIATVAAFSVPILYVPVALLALVTAMVITRAALGLPPGDFFHLLNIGDVGVGIGTAVVLGVVPVFWTFACEKLFMRVRRSLGFKLCVTWLCMLSLSAIIGLVSSMAQPAELENELPLSHACSLPPACGESRIEATGCAPVDTPMCWTSLWPSGSGAHRTVTLSFPRRVADDVAAGGRLSVEDALAILAPFKA